MSHYTRFFFFLKAYLSRCFAFFWWWNIQSWHLMSQAFYGIILSTNLSCTWRKPLYIFYLMKWQDDKQNNHKWTTKDSISSTIHVLEGHHFELHAPVQYGGHLILVLRVELHHADVLPRVLLDVLQSHQGLHLRDGSEQIFLINRTKNIWWMPGRFEVSLGEEYEYWSCL